MCAAPERSEACVGLLGLLSSVVCVALAVTSALYSRRSAKERHAANGAIVTRPWALDSAAHEVDVSNGVAERGDL